MQGYFEDTLPRYQGSIALLHLDCDLHQSYKTCLDMLYSRVMPGGVIMFDEYEDTNFPGAQKAINEFFTDKSEKVIAYNNYNYLKY